jgi:hypothetical protein
MDQRIPINGKGSMALLGNGKEIKILEAEDKRLLPFSVL